MDFVRLDSSYYPDRLIEGYNSLIWTERHTDTGFGEFELKSYDVAGLKALLPDGALVSHLETEEVMQVDGSTIAMVGEGVDAQAEITVVGRSGTTIFEKRWVESSYGKKRRMRRKYSATAAACVLIYNAVDNASGFDVTRGDDDPDTKGEFNDYSWTKNDRLPNIAVTETVASEGTARWWQLEEGILYPQLQRILMSDDLGVRCLRPVKPTRANVITVLTALADRGTLVRTNTADVKSLRFEVYGGVDRSATVKFNLLHGHLNNTQYLTSSRDHKTVVEVRSGEISIGDVYRVGETGVSGWDRKVMDYDAGTPEIPPEPEKPDELGKNPTKAQKEARADAMEKWRTQHGKWKNKRARIVEDFKEEAKAAALSALKQQNRVAVFSGDVTEIAPWRYKTHYDLGDAVMLYGEYGQSAKVVVSEYVRTEDINGDRGYPGFVQP